MTGAGVVDVAGPTDLWAAIEHAHARWVAGGRPRVDDFTIATITVTPEGQRIIPAGEL